MSSYEALFSFRICLVIQKVSGRKKNKTEEKENATYKGFLEQ
jgi:hypothetical protein